MGLCNFVELPVWGTHFSSPRPLRIGSSTKTSCTSPITNFPRWYCFSPFQLSVIQSSRIFSFKIFLVMAWTTSQHLSSRIIFCTMLSTVNVTATLRHSSRFLVPFWHQNTACSEVSSSSLQKVQNGVLVRSNRKRCRLKALCLDRNCVIQKCVSPCLLRTHLRLPGIRCCLHRH